MDQLFLLDMDQRLQSEGPCVAGANSNYYYTIGGLLAYRNLSIPASKLVLGLPYYAHDYLCLVYTENFRCYVQEASYRGSACSSSVAEKVPYNQLSWATRPGYDLWDEHSATVIHNYIVSVPAGPVRSVFSPFNHDAHLFHSLGRTVMRIKSSTIVRTHLYSSTV